MSAGGQPDPAAVRALCRPVLAARILPERDTILSTAAALESAFQQLADAVGDDPPRLMAASHHKAVALGRALVRDRPSTDPSAGHPDAYLWTQGERDRAYQQHMFAYARRLADVVRTLADTLTLKNGLHG
ncbi:hypothetical protein ACFYVL_36020 [Streptomyces sp. NPDC004111]|uniref:hypothetical protein n=1 Tax=Streptomyces sp. NPDC004111 TaxID=3364690 RepID=UPI00369F63E7